MKRIIMLALACPALFCLTAHAQPTRDDIIRAQHVVLDRLAPTSFVRTDEISSYDKNGNYRVGTAFVNRYTVNDDGTLYRSGKVPATLGLWGVTLTRLDEAAQFRPAFVTTASKVKYERREGALYVMKVERLNDIFGFEGRVWVTGGGFVARAEGRHVPKGLKADEKPLRYLYRARPTSYLPAEVVVDDRVEGRQIRVVSRFGNYQRFVAEEVKVLDIGDEEQ